MNAGPATVLISDLSGEKLLGLAQLARAVGVDPKTVRNWVYTGLHDVRLEVQPVGGRLRSSREAVERFSLAVAAAKAAAKVPAVRPPTQRQLDRHERDVRRRLRELGMKVPEPEEANAC